MCRTEETPGKEENEGEPNKLGVCNTMKSIKLIYNSKRERNKVSMS